MSAAEKPGPLTRAAALDCIPVPSADVCAKRLANGWVELSYPMGLRPFWDALARRFGIAGRSMRRLELDEMGTAVWDLIDAQRSVKHVAEAFARHYRLDDQEARAAVVAFLKELGRRGIIGMKDRS